MLLAALYRGPGRGSANNGRSCSASATQRSRRQINSGGLGPVQGADPVCLCGERRVEMAGSSKRRAGHHGSHGACGAYRTVKH